MLSGPVHAGQTVILEDGIDALPICVKVDYFVDQNGETTFSDITNPGIVWNERRRKHQLRLYRIDRLDPVHGGRRSSGAAHWLLAVDYIWTPSNSTCLRGTAPTS
jgi:hypothetical protein